MIDRRINRTSRKNINILVSRTKEQRKKLSFRLTFRISTHINALKKSPFVRAVGQLTPFFSVFFSECYVRTSVAGFRSDQLCDRTKSWQSRWDLVTQITKAVTGHYLEIQPTKITKEKHFPVYFWREHLITLNGVHVTGAHKQCKTFFSEKHYNQVELCVLLM